MLATIPLGYNRDLDDALRDGGLGARVAYLARKSELRWEQVETAESSWPWASGALVYGWPWPGANVLALARWESEPLDLEQERVALAAAGADRREAEAAAVAAQLVHHRPDDPAAGRADRMAERDRAAVHVHLRLVGAEHARRVQRPPGSAH